jgi:hypothetical protein
MLQRLDADASARREVSLLTTARWLSNIVDNAD